MTQIETTAIPKKKLFSIDFSSDRVRTLLTALALFIIFAIGLAFVQFGTTSLADNDGFYHMRMGALVRQYGLHVPFAYLPLSILSPNAFYDHHLLFHVYLSLFGGDGSDQAMIFGAKLASVIMPALAFLAIWGLLRGQKVRYAAIWSIGLLAVSQAFLYRMSMPRAQALSLLILALALHVLLQRKYVWLIPIGFAYVWAYDGFPLLIVVSVVYAIAAAMTDRKLEWQAVVFPTIGIALGLILNPYFPQNISFIVNHLLPKIGASTVSVGNEWYPYETWTLIENSGFALAAFVLGAFALGWRGRKIDRARLTAFGLSIVFGLLLFKARRFIEYFPAFALIFAALSVGQIGNLPNGRQVGNLSNRLIPIDFGAILIAALMITLTQGRAAMIDQGKPADTYAAASHWLSSHTPTGSLVFQTDWDDFPRLFFYNTSNIYTIGLDPTYMELYDADLYNTWVKITQGKIEQPSSLIRSRFNAAYVMTDLAHTSFLQKAKIDPGLHEVYRDQYAVLFTVVNN